MDVSPAHIWTAANGFAHVMTDDVRAYQRLASLLVWRYGFIRFGRSIPAIADEAIFPSFVRWRLRIFAGWDDASGYYLLANSTRADVFLRSFHAKHCRAVVSRSAQCSPRSGPNGASQ